MDYADEVRAREVSKETGVSAELLKCVPAEHMHEVAVMVNQAQAEQVPKIPAAARGVSSRVMRGGEHKPTNAEIFTEFMRGRRW